ncbi:MAG: SMC family ATPase [Sandaracinaceae bacterium]|nr:SMC family ATPase [Sandaracinaceae bacterium]
MKPLRLEMTAFGPFAGKEVVDFRDLRGARLFLIHGDTGAGKSTILDGICTALYGVSAGGERTPEQLRSDHADPDTMTELQLDFAIGDACYRVQRFPAQERPKKRGEGVILENASATLWRLASDQPGAAVVEVLAERKVSTVLERVHELIGFEVAQFRRVVVLPQGQFRDLLSAGAKEREDILRALFDTAAYSRAEQDLKRRASALKRDIDDRGARREGLLSSEGVVTHDELLAKIEGKQRAQRVLSAEAKQAADAAAACERMLEQGKQRHARFQQRDDAEDARARLAAEAESVEAERQRHLHGTEALGLVPAYDALQGAKKKRAERTDKRDRAAAEAKTRLAEVERAREAAGAAAEERAKRDERQGEYERLDKLAGFAREWARRVTAREKAERGLDAAVASKASAETARDSAQTALAVLDAELLALADSPAQLAEAEAEVKATAARLAQHQQAAALTEAVRKLSEARDRAEAQCARAQAALDTATVTVRALQTAMRVGRAAILAQELEPGQPCPVCGSAEHPAPAGGHEQLPSDEDLAAAEKAQGEAQAALTTAQQALTAAAATLDAKRELQAAQLAALDGESLPAAEQRAQHAVQLRDTALARTRRRAEAQTQRAGLASAEAEARKAYEEARDAETVARNQQQEAEKEEAAALALLGGEPQDPEDLSARAAALQTLLRTAEAAHEAAQAVLQQAETEHTKSTSAETAAVDELAAAQAEVDAAERAWAEALQASPFTDEAGFTAARMSKEALAQNHARVRAHEDALKEVQARLTALDAELAGQARPQLDTLEAAAQRAREDSQRATKRQGEEANSLERARQVCADYEAAQQAVAALEQRYLLVDGLAKVANGTNSAKINLHRFVLASFLDEVLLQASQHLAKTSRGRYRLVRRTTQGDGRTAQGLDLDIDDHYTGEQRPATTLSGGEGFLAALALALGLADVVQAHFGGIRIETVFVDEGFGSLDAETLDLAVETLLELQQTGRMVGVISHVSELKERIDVQLEVTKHERGSRTRFRLPGYRVS